MSPQTETKASVGFKAGVKDYKLTYYTPGYETKDTDILAAFRVTPQPGVPPEEAGAAVAALYAILFLLLVAAYLVCTHLQFNYYI